jgi:hypothetical protein
LQEIATIDVGAGNMVRPLSRTDFMVAFGTARQVACEALGSAAAGPDAPGLNAARNMGFMK